MENFSLNMEFEELVKQTIEQNQLPLSGMTEPATKTKQTNQQKNEISFRIITISKKKATSRTQQLA